MVEGLAAIEGKIKERLCEVLSVGCLRFRVELSFPCLLLVYALADERGEHCQMKEEPVDQIGGKTQRFPEIDEQDHARIGRVVPGLVLIGIIENDRTWRLQVLVRKCKSTLYVPIPAPSL